MRAMKINAYLILLIAIFPLVASAQSSKPFSQLEFDKAEKVSRDKKLNTILGEENPEGKPGSSVEAEEQAIKAALNQFSSKEYLLEGPSSFLTPRIKGPATNPDNKVSITSELGWAYTKGAFCKIPNTAESLCKKTMALKEVLFRFSGNDDFFDASCEQHSCANGEKAVLSDLAFPQLEQGMLDLITVGSECRYNLQKGPTKNWVLMRAQSAICSCLPADCLNKK